MDEGGISYLTIQRPMLAEELVQMAKDMAGSDQDLNVQAEKVAAENTLRLAMVSATRRKAYDRFGMQNRARRWLRQRLGVEEGESLSLEGVDDADLRRTWLVIWNAADIVGALVPERSDFTFWQPPEELEDWADVPDFIFSPALERAWELNPQWFQDWIDTTSPEGTPGNR